jgi:hypothetical protein
MRLIRSWPANIPEGRSYVVDDIERFVMGAAGDNYDYRHLVDYHDDIVLIEWDIAVGGEQLRRFIDRARAEPDRVRVAPYLLYRGGRDGRSPQVPFYCHRIREPGMRTWVKGPADTYCHYFGFGLIYLPQALIERFVGEMSDHGRFGDTEFSRWHARQPIGEHRKVPIEWDCHAVHLHYITPEVH